MSLIRKKTADLNTSSTVKAAQRARAAGSAAAANAASAAQNAAAVATNAAQNAAVAAQNASGAAQTTATSLSKGVSKGVKDKVYTARRWAAPRLESAADYTANTVAPKVSSALRTTARQVSPPDTSNSKRTVLTWTALGAAIAAALGAAAAVVRYRYRAAIAADSETADDEVSGDSTDSKAAPVTPDGTRPAAAMPKDPSTETSVNGRVSSTGR